MAKLEFCAPSKSDAHKALRTLATDSGFDEMALRQMLWLLNAHPTLVAHARIFGNLSASFDLPASKADEIAWASNWKNQLPAFRELTAWGWQERQSIARHPALRRFDVAPTHSRNHPLLGEGIERHGVPGALWNAHQSANAPRNSGGVMSSATRYATLQAHLFLAYAECRFRLSSREFYEGYDGKDERPVAPMRSSSVSPGVRELSHDRYASILLQLPTSASTVEFARDLQTSTFSFQEVPETYQSSASYAVASVARFFRLFLDVVGGWKPTQHRRRGWGGGGGNARRPGFIHGNLADGVYFRLNDGPENLTDDDPDAASPGDSPSSWTAFVDLDPDADDDPISVELSGLCPTETLEEVITLFPHDQLNENVLKLHQQQLAIEARAQCLPFDVNVLTSCEVDRLWQAATASISHFSNDLKRNQEATDLAIGAAAAKLCLAFGQPVEKIATLRFMTIDGLENLNFSGPSESDLPAIVLESVPGGDSVTARALGLCLPAITPNYRSDLDPSLEEIDRPYVPWFVLPDFLGVIHEILDAQLCSRVSKGRLFTLPAAKLSKLLKAFLIAHDLDERISPNRICRYVSTQVSSLHGDSCLSAILTADTSGCDESRLHYTRYSVTTIRETYRRVCQRICRCIGVPLRTDLDQLCDSVTPQGGVGARFVIRLDEVKALIANLKARLRDGVTSGDPSERVIREHHDFLVYTLLMQSLSTSIRAINAPTALYEAWLQQHSEGPMVASLQDKDNEEGEKARLATISADLDAQFHHYAAHAERIGRTRGFSLFFDTHAGRAARPFFVLNQNYEFFPVTTAWFAEQLYALTGYRIPANFHRAFLRTELLERRCSAEAIDAYLGHSNAGEAPFGNFSTFDYARYGQEIATRLAEIHTELRLEPIPSRLVTTEGQA